MTAPERKAISRLASLLRGAERRCNRPRIPRDAAYAGVGYRFEGSFLDAAQALYARLGPIPKGCSLDRIDPRSPYSLENLRYATREEQAANKRTSQKEAMERRREWLAEFELSEDE